MDSTVDSIIDAHENATAAWATRAQMESGFSEPQKRMYAAIRAFKKK
jgi:hypothetical protein